MRLPVLLGLAGVWHALLACGPRCPMPSSAAPAGSALVKPAAPAVADGTRAARSRQTPLPEDERGVAGAPRDDTAFEFEPEIDEDHDREPVLDGAERVSRTVLRTLPPYLEARRARLAGTSADGKRMLVLTRLGDTTHVHQVAAPLAVRQQITYGHEPVQQVAFVPGSGRSIVYRSDAGGTEDFQIFQLDLDSRSLRRLTDGTSRHGPFRWAPGGNLMAFSSNARNGTDMDVWVRDQQTGATRRLGAVEGQRVVLGWSKDGSQLAVQEYRSASESAIHVMDPVTGATRTVAPAEPGVSYPTALFHASGDRLFVTSDRDGNFVELFEVNLATNRWRPLTRNLGWNVDRVALSADGRLLVYSANEDGVSVLRQVDTATWRSRVLRGVPPGEIEALRFVGSSRTIAFTLATATQPPDVYTHDLSGGHLVRWTASEIGGLPPGRFISPSLERYRSFDGLAIPAYYYRPRGPGPFPVLIWVHGGPEEQSRPSFDPIIQYFAAERGVAVVAPNVRGSEGYGKAYRGLDDGRRRLDAVQDIGALLDWIGSREELDASRVGIHGASYGGFVVLASLVEYGSRIVAGCNVVGISDLVTFLENTRGYRRDLRRQEYGDERDPEMREYLRSISPLTHVHRIRSALLVAHGAKDPRVPVDEALQLVKAVRDRGSEAWFFLAANEGHGFRKRRNRDSFYQVMATFFERHLLEPG